MFIQCERRNMRFATYIFLHGPVWSRGCGYISVMRIYCEVQRILYLHGSSSDEEVLCCSQDISSNITTRVQHLNGDRRVIRKVLDETLQVFSPSGRGALILLKHGIILGSGKEWTQALEASCRPPASPLISSPSVNTNDIPRTHMGIRGKERETEKVTVDGNVSKHSGSTCYSDGRGRICGYSFHVPCLVG